MIPADNTLMQRFRRRNSLQRGKVEENRRKGKIGLKNMSLKANPKQNLLDDQDNRKSISKGLPSEV